MITVIVVVVAIISTQRQIPTTSRQKTILFPDFKAVINNVQEVSIKQGKETLTVVNESGKWKIRKADGYPALFSKIKQTAVAVSEMKVISKKTENPELYPKLGVEEPTADDAKSSLLTLSDSAGKPLVSLIVGKNRLSSAASDSHGLYVRLPGKKQALLVETNLKASVKVADWIDRDLVNISPDRISTINIDHGGNQDVSFRRVKDKKDLVLENIPNGKRARSDYTLNRMEGILENVRIDNVTADTKIRFPDSAVTTSVTTTDGLSAVITSAALEDKHYAKFTFQYTAPANPEKESAAGNKTDEDKEKAKTDSKKTIDAASQAAELSAKTVGWVYQIPAYKYDTFTRKLNDLVEDIPKKQDDKEKSKK